MIIFAASKFSKLRTMADRFFIMLVALFLLNACNSGDHCYESSESLMVTTFIGNKAIKIDSILVRGYNRYAKGDTLAFSKPGTLSVKVGLPLSLLSDSTGFMVFANGRSNAFWIRHTMNLQLISESCGFAPNYQLTGTKHSTLIDSVKVADKSVDPKSVERYATNGQNITVYLHLSTP